jgi:hypothetical protein
MHITRFYATADGESRFAELDIPLEQVHQDPFGNILRSSNSYVSPSVRFVELPAEMVQGWHGAPTRQIVVVLSGVLEVGTSDQQTRQWRAGEVFLAEDVTGKGHTTHVVEGPVRLVFVPLPPEFVPERWSA